MLGNLDLWFTEDLLEMTNTKGRVGQQMQDAKSRGIAEALINLD
jgi:hypothetical protein